MSIEDCIDLNSLPYFTTLFIEQLGQPAAFRIMRAVGGRQVDVPKYSGKESRKKKVLASDMRLLRDNYGGCRIYIPSYARIEKQVRNAKIRRHRDGGLSIAELSDQFSLSERMIFNILEKE